MANTFLAYLNKHVKYLSLSEHRCWHVIYSFFCLIRLLGMQCEGLLLYSLIVVRACVTACMFSVLCLQSPLLRAKVLEHCTLAFLSYRISADCTIHASPLIQHNTLDTLPFAVLEL
jgi:hypothetical protein